MVTEVDRLIALEGAVNFRDLGGYAAGGGTRTRWRTLFRADGLGELTEADLSVLRPSASGRSSTCAPARSSSAAGSTSTPTRWPSITSPSSTSCPTRRSSTAGPACSARSTSRCVARRRRPDPGRPGGAGRPRRAPGRLPLHGGQGPHRGPLRHRAVAARRRRADGRGRLRAQRRRHAAAAGQARGEVPRGPGDD